MIELQIMSISSRLPLGTYRLPNNREIPASSVLPDRELGYDYPPSDTEINGLEFIFQSPVTPVIHSLLGGDVLEEYRYRIILKEWSANEVMLGESLKVLLRILETEGYDFSSPLVIPASQELNLVTMAEITITEKIIVSEQGEI